MDASALQSKKEIAEALHKLGWNLDVEKKVAKK